MAAAQPEPPWGGWGGGHGSRIVSCCLPNDFAAASIASEGERRIWRHKLGLGLGRGRGLGRGLGLGLGLGGALDPDPGDAGLVAAATLIVFTHIIIPVLQIWILGRASKGFM